MTNKDFQGAKASGSLTLFLPRMFLRAQVAQSWRLSEKHVMLGVGLRRSRFKCNTALDYSDESVNLLLSKVVTLV